MANFILSSTVKLLTKVGNRSGQQKVERLCARSFNNSAVRGSVVRWERRERHGLKSDRVTSFLLSDIGEGIREVSIKEWFVSVGDKVNQFDSICEVQSDKASVTITSRYDGVVRKLHYEVDETALVGKPLVDIEVRGEGNEDQVDQVQDQDAAPTSGSGEGYVLHNKSDRVLATPAVRRIASENNVHLSDVRGSGKDGRILKEDMIEHVERMKRGTTTSVADVVPKEAGETTNKSSSKQHEPTPPPLSSSVASSSSSSASMIDDDDVLEDRVEAIKGFQKAMVKTMTASLSIPHFGYADEINVDELIKLRDIMNKEKVFSSSNGHVRITYLPFFIKAASLALSQFPILNASVDANCENIRYKAAHNIGIAMNTSRGLVVPNIKHVQKRTVLEIATELNRLRDLGRDGRLSREDVTGGTFTLSNVGMIGGTYLKPVILPPEVAIGAIGKIQTLPRFDDRGNVVAANLIQVSWSADHRVIDGATMASFAALWKSYVENPGTMLLALK